LIVRNTDHSSRSSGATPERLRSIIVALWLITVTLTMQYWVGFDTIYADTNADRVAGAHEQILTNTPPAGGWMSKGMNSVNIRLAAVWIGEQVHQTTGLSVIHSYFAVDTVMLFLGLLLLYRYLLRFVEPVYAVVCVSLISGALPLTYQLFWQHPWDRMSFVMWLLTCMLLHHERWLQASLMLLAAMLVKFDIMVLPGIVGLYGLLRDRAIRIKPVAVTIGMFGLTIGTYVALRALRPGGFAVLPDGYTHTLLAGNLADLHYMNLHWPPLLGFAIPCTLAAFGLRDGTAWIRAGVIFGALMFVPFTLRSNLAEYRAQTSVLILLAPAMALGARRILGTAF
jgi:hypothetical protein